MFTAQIGIFLQLLLFYLGAHNCMQTMESFRCCSSVMASDLGNRVLWCPVIALASAFK